MTVTRLAAIALVFGACNDGPALSSLEQDVNTTPSIGTFVLYAERSVVLGSHDSVSGNVGVAITATGVTTQLTLSDHIAASDLYAPSVLLGDHSSVHDVYATASQVQSNVAMHSSQTFPIAGMPPLPLAIGGTPGTSNVNIATPTQLAPGSYGTLDNHSVLTLTAGTYTFSNVTLESHTVLNATGAVNVRVVGRLTVLDHVAISASSAQNLRFDVSGDDVATASACAIGSHTSVHALISAPHGTIAFSDHVSATGAFAASDITVDVNAALSLDQGFPATSAGEQGSQQLVGYFGVQTDPSVAPVVGAVPSTTQLSLSIGLPVRDPVGLQAFVDTISDPKSPMFRQYLTNDQFVQLYGATSTDYAAVQQWAGSSGLTVTRTYPSNLLLTVYGTATQIESALHVNLLYRQADDKVSRFAAVDREPSIDLVPNLLWISGLTGYVTPHADCPDFPGLTSHDGRAGEFSGANIRNAYLSPTQSDQTCEHFDLDGSGEVVGVVAEGSFIVSDILGYANEPTNGIGGITIGGPDTSDQVTWSSIVGIPFSFLGDQIENDVDVDMVLAMAPRARVHEFQGNAQFGNADDILHAMANDPDLTVATNSWRLGYSTNADQAITQMAARGISFFSSSGDYGNVGDPGSLLHAHYITIVGGTFLLDGNGLGETSWNELCAGADFSPAGLSLLDNDISGGGVMNGKILANSQPHSDPFGEVCSCYPEPVCCGDAVGIPEYQKSVSTVSGFLGSTNNRNYPDVAAVAFGADIYSPSLQGGNGWEGNAGTSVATPVWAGFAALANQAARENGGNRIGFLNPLIYDIGTSPARYASGFIDIQDGVSNQVPSSFGFPAVAGYDLVTGWGAPRCGLITQLGLVSTEVPAAFPLIRVHVVNGHDGLDDGTEVSLDIFDSSLTSPLTIPLKSAGDSGWDAIGVAHDLSISVDALLPSQPGHLINPFDVSKVTLRVSGGDNWDVAGLNVELQPISQLTASACIVDLSGSGACDTQESSCQGSSLSDGNPGVVRLGPDGQGTSVDFAMKLGPDLPPSWGGCQTWVGPLVADPIQMLHFEFDTGDDDLDSETEVDFNLLGKNPDGTPSSTVIESGVVHMPGDGAFEDQTQHVVDVSLSDNERCLGCTPFDVTSVSAIKFRVFPAVGCAGTCLVDWHVEEVRVSGENSSSAAIQTCLVGGPPGQEFDSIFCVSPCINYIDITQPIPLGTGCAQ